MKTHRVARVVALAIVAAASVAVTGAGQAGAESPADTTGEWVAGPIEPATPDDGIVPLQEALPEPLVINGEDVDGGQYPWSGFVLIGTRNTGFAVCGGSLIAPRWVLTAAHCVTNPGKLPASIVSSGQVRVAFGGPNLPASLGSSRFRGAATVFVHKGYNANNLHNDVALIKLKSSVNQPTLPLAKPGDTEVHQPKRMVTVAGWGITKPGGSIASVQQKATIPLRSNKDCRSFYGGYRADMNLCAGFKTSEANKPQGACKGDSGSALMAYTRFGPVQIGIVSFGFGDCTLLSRFGFYTRVSTYRASIVELIGSLPSPPPTPKCNRSKATITGTSGADLLVGTQKRDIIVARGGDDEARGLQKNDVICLGDGADTGLGGDGDDRVLGERGPDLLRGDNGDDILQGGTGGDQVHGGSGADRLDGGENEDQLFGERGRDTVLGGPQADHLDGGPDRDECDGGVGQDSAKKCEVRIDIP